MYSLDFISYKTNNWQNAMKHYLQKKSFIQEDQTNPEHCKFIPNICCISLIFERLVFYRILQNKFYSVTVKNIVINISLNFKRMYLAQQSYKTFNIFLSSDERLSINLEFCLLVIFQNSWVNFILNQKQPDNTVNINLRHTNSFFSINHLENLNETSNS